MMSVLVLKIVVVAAVVSTSIVLFHRGSCYL